MSGTGTSFFGFGRRRRAGFRPAETTRPCASGSLPANSVGKAEPIGMMSVFSQLRDAIHQEGCASLVSLLNTDGSSPREAGARMVVRPSGGFQGSIGGGALEWEALACAQAELKRGRGPVRFLRWSLGPQLGQCCGGRITLMIETFDPVDLTELARLAETAENGALQTVARLAADGRWIRETVKFASGRRAIVQLTDGLIEESFADPASRLLLFGAGHVGKAVVWAMAPLPFTLRWIDPRPDIFPEIIPQNAISVQTPDVLAELEAAASGAFVLIMTHSHALDLDIVSKALALGRFPYVGLIGSHSKRARFTRKMAAVGLDDSQIAGLTCPIGIAGITAKEPAIIAAATAAQLLMVREQHRARMSQ
jgi:xanthine dehydrogenase accessory factor